MKKHLFAAAATLAVIAGSAANADDWTGFYVGGAVSSVDTAISWTGFPFDYTGSDSAVLGVFAGYNHQLSNGIVIGGELGYSPFESGNYPLTSYVTEDLMQARARVGYALGGVLPYVAFGIAQSEASIVGTPFSEGLDGMSFGLGVEYMLNEQISMRVDYTSATVDTDVVGPFPPGYEATINMISIGAAFHF